MPKTPSKAKPSRKISRAGDDVDANSPGSAGQAVQNANKWREQYNYLRGLMMARAVQLLEAGLNGDLCELQRVFALCEASSGTYYGLVERCLAPFADFEWQIKTVPEDKLPPGTTKEQADAQATSLRNAYDAVDNLQEAIEHLAMADFRGFAHVQKQRVRCFFDGGGNIKRGFERFGIFADSNPNDILHLECLPTWKFCRDGLFGDWFWNPQMFITGMNAPAALGETNRIGGETLPREDFIIHEVRTPIDRVGLQFFIYTKLAEKNYAGFMEIYGIPSGVVTMPANVPKEQLDEYELTARRVAEGGSGAIPNGATYTANDSPRASDPFGPFLKYWQEQLILAGTSGKLTMLAESGSGTLAGGAHKDSFGEVAAMRAKKISENFQRDFDAEVLQRYHADEPRLAYFEICAKDETDVTQFVADVLALKNAGKNVDTDFIAEKTGYQFGEDDAAPDPNLTAKNAENAKMLNRLAYRSYNRAGDSAEVFPELAAQFKAAVAEDLRPYLARLAERLPAITAIGDADLRQQKLDAAFAELDATIGADILQDPASARILEHLTATALADGLSGEKLANRYLFNGDVPGHEFHGNQWQDVGSYQNLPAVNRTRSEQAAEKLLDKGDQDGETKSPFPARELSKRQQDKFLSMRGKAQPAQVELSKLTGTQASADTENVRNFLHDPQVRTTLPKGEGFDKMPDEKDYLPFVVKDKTGNLQIVDGHHRLTAEYLRGAKSANVLLLDASAVKSKLRNRQEVAK